MSQQQEIELGKKAVRELRKQGIHEESCLTGVGNALKAEVVRKDLPWHFWVIDSPGEYNAFAVPGGFVFITRAYYRRLADNELAFVIGHEMTHVEKRHFEQTQKRAKQAWWASAALSLLLGRGSSGWQTAGNLGTTAFETHYSRKLEKEADVGGMQLMQKAGYDVRGAVEAMEKLREKEDKELPHWLAQVYATHPLLSSREEQLKALGKEAGPPVARPVCKLAEAAPKAKPPAERKTQPPAEKKAQPPARPGLALRVEGNDGKLWGHPWRADLTALLRRRLTEQRKLRVSEELVLYQPDISDPVAEAKRRGATYLLTVTIRKFDEANEGGATDDGQRVKISLDLAARMTDLDSGKALWTGEAREQSAGVDFVPSEKERLWPDTTASLAADAALAKLERQATKSVKTEAAAP